MKPTDLEDRVRELNWPAPSEELRARVLAGASVQARVLSWSDRVWFSRPWRVSMAAAVLVLLGAQLITNWENPSGHATASSMSADAEAIREAGREAGLPVEVAALLARRAIPRPAALAIDPQGDFR